ncbi:unnamed protein product [Urochloa humidicola]
MQVAGGSPQHQTRSHGSTVATAKSERALAVLTPERLLGHAVRRYAPDAHQVSDILPITVSQLVCHVLPAFSTRVFLSSYG